MSDYSIIAGYCCVYGVMDGHGTVWERGCFSESIKTTGRENPMPLFFAHDIWGRVPVGGVHKMRSDSAGVWYEAHIYDVEAGRHMTRAIQDGTVNGTSFSFTDVTTRLKDDVLHFQKATMREVSPCVWPSIQETNCIVVECDALGVVKNDERTEKFLESRQAQIAEWQDLTAGVLGLCANNRSKDNEKTQ